MFLTIWMTWRLLVIYRDGYSSGPLTVHCSFETSHWRWRMSRRQGRHQSIKKGAVLPLTLFFYASVPPSSFFRTNAVLCGCDLVEAYLIPLSKDEKKAFGWVSALSCRSRSGKDLNFIRAYCLFTERAIVDKQLFVSWWVVCMSEHTIFRVLHVLRLSVALFSQVKL